MIERHIDYLQFSARFSEIMAIEKQYQLIPAPRFYKRGYQSPDGIRYYFGNPNSAKALVICSGAVLQNFRAGGKLDAEILQWAFEYDAVVSRLDLAVTEWVDSTLFTLEDVELWWRDGLFSGALVSGGAKKISSFADDMRELPETFYIGDMSKRGKRGIFRAYNKGIELNIGDYLATRIELEERGENSHNTAKRIAETNDIAGNFRARLDCASKDFERIMDADAVDLARGQGKVKVGKDEKMEDRWRWLIEQVAPALQDAVEYEAKRGEGMPKLTEFLYASGLVSEMRRGADLLAFWDKQGYDSSDDK